MLRKQFCTCKCYFEQNLYLKEYNMHFTYINSTQFLNEYTQVLGARGYKEPLIIEQKLKDEVARRKIQVEDFSKRVKQIQENYVSLHPDVFTFSEDILDPSFLKISESVERGECDLDSLEGGIQQHLGNLFSLPIFNKSFCDKLIEEIKHFESSPLPKTRPNTMNNYGVNVDELGFEPLISKLRTTYLNPLANVLFPEWVGTALDSHKAFVVSYRLGEDVDLSYHYDNAEVTLNVSLNDAFSDGALVFGPMRFEESSFRYGCDHATGRGILHRGQQMHMALPITEGERYNLIIWMRSSSLRNELCPMCDRCPSLEPVTEGTGDGLTQTVTDGCCTS